MDIKHAFVKVLNFVQREFAYSSQIDLQGHYLPFGPYNAFPNKLADLIEGSPTATACISTISDFIIGEGFNKGKELEKKKVNPQGLTLFQYHAIMGNTLATYWGMAAIIKYTKGGAFAAAYPVPFNYCRLGKPDDAGIISKIHYNPYFGTGEYRSQDTEIYDSFAPEQAITQFAGDKNWKGQIFWFGIRDRKDPFYPMPDYVSAKEWMNVEKNAAVYFDNNLENGFLQEVVMKMIGDPNDPSGLKNSAGEDIPKGQAFNDEMSKNFGKGAKTRHRMIAAWGANKEEWPEIMAIPNSANSDLFRTQDDQATKKITIAMKVPGILANISEGVSLGGDGNTLRAATKVMQQRVKPFQAILTDHYDMLLKLMGSTESVTIVPYNAFPETENVDPQVWAELTPEERRKWIADHTEIEIVTDQQPNATPEPSQEPAPTQNKAPQNMFFNSYPKTARDNVKLALEWQQKFNSKCIKGIGVKLGEKILAGTPLSQGEIRRIANFLNKNTLDKAKPFDESCNALQYYGWGGSEMMVWANEKIRELSGKAD